MNSKFKEIRKYILWSHEEVEEILLFCDHAETFRSLFTKQDNKFLKYLQKASLKHLQGDNHGVILTPNMERYLAGLMRKFIKKRSEFIKKE